MCSAPQAGALTDSKWLGRGAETVGSVSGWGVGSRLRAESKDAAATAAHCALNPRDFFPHVEWGGGGYLILDLRK